MCGRGKLFVSVVLLNITMLPALQCVPAVIDNAYTYIYDVYKYRACCYSDPEEL